MYGISSKYILSNRKRENMKTGKRIYSEAFPEYRMTDNDLKKLQECLLAMFVDIKTLCDENDISYMMSGGSLLGTIRHKGFIPWDDDIDIMMVRSEYEKFRKVFKKQNSNKYILAEPLVNDDYYYKMPKVYKKGTTLITVKEAGYPKYNMVGIDIFIIEYVPKSVLHRKIRGFLYDLAFHGSSVCFDYMYPSPLLLEKQRNNNEIKKFYSLRCNLGAVFSRIGGIDFYLKICDNLGKYKKKSPYMSVPSAISYNREVLDASTFLSLTKAEFCGYEVNIPEKYDVYLKNLYGDYMTIPSVENREIHVAYMFEL